MPRSIQDILDHADELAKRFDDFDPDQAREIPVDLHGRREAGCLESLVKFST